MRALLDEPAFYSELSDYLKGVNDALEKANILSYISAISRSKTKLNE